ncbi:MAG: preprotein translocase subunit YajC [Bacteroidales bacterium]|nr:preprotein translocase subunit YajC [Bacteroidales bacterium]
MNFLTLLQAQTASTAQSGGSSWSFLLMMVLIFVIMWLFMIRPQQKKQKELNKWRDSLKKGDKVVTIGGIYGTVDEVKDNTALVIVDQNVKIRVEKSALQKDFTAQQ